MNWEGKEIDFFAVKQSNSKKGNLKYELSYSNGFYNGKILPFSQKYSNIKNKEFYNKFILIAFTNDVDERENFFEYFKNIVKGFKIKEYTFYCAFPHQTELYLLYKEEKRFENPLVKKFPLIEKNVKDQKFNLSKSYIEYCISVIQELKTKTLPYEYDSYKEFLNYKRFELFKKSYVKLNNNYKDKKKIEKELNISLNKLEFDNDILKGQNSLLTDEIKKILPVSKKYTKEDFQQYEDIYSKYLRWKDAFYELQKVTTNEYIKNTTYISFQGCYNNFKNK